MKTFRRLRNDMSIKHLFPHILMHFANFHWFVQLDRFEKFDLYSLLVLCHSIFRPLMTQKCPKFIGDGSVPYFGIFCCCCTRETMPSIICEVIECAGTAIRTYSHSHRCIANGWYFMWTFIRSGARPCPCVVLSTLKISILFVCNKLWLRNAIAMVIDSVLVFLLFEKWFRKFSGRTKDSIYNSHTRIKHLWISLNISDCLCTTHTYVCVSCAINKWKH